jgi:hypothetical protein
MWKNHNLGFLFSFIFGSIFCNKSKEMERRDQSNIRVTYLYLPFPAFRASKVFLL